MRPPPDEDANHLEKPGKAAAAQELLRSWILRLEPFLLQPFCWVCAMLEVEALCGDAILLWVESFSAAVEVAFRDLLEDLQVNVWHSSLLNVVQHLKGVNLKELVRVGG